MTTLLLSVLLWGAQYPEPPWEKRVVGYGSSMWQTAAASIAREDLDHDLYSEHLVCAEASGEFSHELGRMRCWTTVGDFYDCEIDATVRCH